MSVPIPTSQISCSFCGKGSHELAVLIRNGRVSICNECVALCVEILLTDHLQQAASHKAATKGHGQ